MKQTKTKRDRFSWKKAALKLAECVIATVQTDGKIGMGSGLVMKTVEGKRVVERWDKDFIEALAYIGLVVGEPAASQPKKKRRSA